MDYEQCITTKNRLETLFNERRSFSAVWFVDDRRVNMEVGFPVEDRVYIYIYTGTINIELGCNASKIDVVDVECKDEFVLINVDKGYLAIHEDATFYDKDGEEISF